MRSEEENGGVPDAAIGSCATCRHHREQRTPRGSCFHRCLRADSDARFLRYPPLPVLRCIGYEAARANDEEPPPSAADEDRHL